jgi:predicted O-methyltransferase YrrM
MSDRTLELELPSQQELINLFEEASVQDTALLRTKQALATGRYVDSTGREVLVGELVLKEDQLGLLIWLGKQCKTHLSVEVGFGMGSSASAILSARRSNGRAFEHVVFDPLPASEIIAADLHKMFPTELGLKRLPSELGLGQLVQERGYRSTALVFIDGSHHFENVMADFLLANHLCCEGGYIVFDDANAPAIESVINYIFANRPDYAVAQFGIRTVVLHKIASDAREWNAFTPFSVPNRSDWTLGCGRIPFS